MICRGMTIRLPRRVPIYLWWDGTEWSTATPNRGICTGTRDAILSFVSNLCRFLPDQKEMLRKEMKEVERIGNS